MNPDKGNIKISRNLSPWLGFNDRPKTLTSNQGSRKLNQDRHTMFLIDNSICLRVPGMGTASKAVILPKLH
jgi:hypothetical protein